MIRTLRLVLLVFTLDLVGCASVYVSTDFDPAIDFGAYQSFAWLPEPTQSTGDPRIDSPLLAQRIRAAVERELAARSFRKADSGTPDFYIGYHLSLETRVDVRSVDSRYGYGPGWHGSPMSHTYVTEYEEGTLIVDFIDARLDRLAWRGSGSRRVSRETTPEQSTQNVNLAVADILASFPPAQRGE